MNYKIFKFSLLVIVSMMFSRCDLPNEISGWEPEIIAPIATSKANIKELSDLEDKVFEYSLPSADIGFPAGPQVTVPLILINSIGPTIFNVSDFHESVEVQTAQFIIQVSNAFPISISEGTKLVFRNQDDTNDPDNVIFEHVIPREILPGDHYTFTTLLADKLINNKIYFYIESFQSPGGTDVIFSPNGIEMRFELSFLEIKMVKIKTGQELEVTQNLAVALVNETSGPDDDLATGSLDVFIKNELPMNVGLQVYFYGEDDETIIDSIFEGISRINGGITDDLTGNSSQPSESKVTILLNEEKMRHIKESDRVRMYFDVNTLGFPGSSVSSNRDLNFEFQIVGDVKLNIQL